MPPSSMIGHPVGDGARETHFVRDHDHRHPALGEIVHHVEDFLDHHRIERGGRFVEQHDPGPHAERPRDRRPLLLTARKLAGVLPGLLGNPDPVEELHGAIAGVRGGHPEHPGRAQHAVVEHGEVGEEVELLEHHPDLAADPREVRGVRAELPPREDDASFLVFLEPVDAADQRGLARPGRAADHDALALRDPEVHAAEHLERAEPLAHAVEFDQRLSWSQASHRFRSGPPPRSFRAGRTPARAGSTGRSTTRRP